MTEHVLHLSSDAMILMKNGAKKYGRLLFGNSSEESCRFVPSGQLPFYEESVDNSMVETLSFNTIESIDMDLK